MFNKNGKKKKAVRITGDLFLLCESLWWESSVEMPVVWWVWSLLVSFDLVNKVRSSQYVEFLLPEGWRLIFLSQFDRGVPI